MEKHFTRACTREPRIEKEARFEGRADQAIRSIFPLEINSLRAYLCSAPQGDMVLNLLCNRHTGRGFDAPASTNQPDDRFIGEWGRHGIDWC